MIFAGLQDTKYLSVDMSPYPAITRYEQNVMASSNGHYSIHKDGNSWSLQLPGI